MSLFSSLQVSASGMAAQRTRAQLLVENMANAETTRTPSGGPYRRQDAVFSTELQASPFSKNQRSASRTTGTIARKCSREASSGTTPPYFKWVSSCEATTDERMIVASSTTAAAVSSQDDSIPRISAKA